MIGYEENVVEQGSCKLSLTGSRGSRKVLSAVVRRTKNTTAKQQVVLVESRRNGRLPEWLMGTGCKPVGYAYLGSNPRAPTIMPV